MPVLAFLYVLAHSSCKPAQMELRNHQFWFCAETVPSEIPGSLRGNLRGNPCVGMGQPLQEGFAWSTSTLCSATRACPTQNPTGAALCWSETPRHVCI